MLCDRPQLATNITAGAAPSLTPDHHQSEAVLNTQKLPCEQNLRRTVIIKNGQKKPSVGTKTTKKSHKEQRGCPYITSAAISRQRQLECLRTLT